MRGPYGERIETCGGAWFARTVKTDRNDPSGLNERAGELNRLKRFEEAFACLNEAIARKPDFAEAFATRGITLRGLRRFDEAVASYDRAIALAPGYAEAFNGRGNTLQVLRRFELALASYDRAIALKPDYVDAIYNKGIALQELKRFDQALASYQQVNALAPDSAETLNSMGYVYGALNRLDEALASFERAIALRPGYAEAHNNRGNALRALKRFGEGLASYDQAIALKPDYADALLNRAKVLTELKRFDEALASYDRVIALRPRSAEAFFDRGNTLQQLERFDDALASYDRSIALAANSAATVNNRGNALQELGRVDEAIASYDQAIAIDPEFAEAYSNRGTALQQRKRFDEALASYDKAVALKPDYAEAFNNRGHLLKDEGKRVEAVADFGQALALKPDYGDARFALCMTQLPILYMDQPEIAQRRAAYQEQLEALRDDFGAGRVPRELCKAVGSSQPYFLAYQGFNDRALQSLYGSLVCRIIAQHYPPAALSPPPRADEPVRVGIVSGFFWNHSNWKIPIKGWLGQIDRRRFRVFGYHTGLVEDAETKQASALCDRFVQGPLSLDRWRKAILEDAPHVLIYPEVGMNAVSTRLAAQRLAPVQCDSWGHPDTSGFPTLDYYLGSELMEPPDAQEHYTERLVRLPNLSIYYEPPAPRPVSLERPDLGLRPTATIYWCGQALFKYLPQFDQILPRIAREVDDCQFVFIKYEQGTYLNEQFAQRLDRAFAAFGLRATDHCAFLPRLDIHRFAAAIGQCDIVLDSIGWSGCNSTLEGLHHDLPIVTMIGSLMRGRHTMAILKMMGVEETITETLDDYVSVAIRLGRDLPWRAAVKDKMSKNRHRVYNDRSCVSALEKFLDSAARRTL